MFSFYGGEPGKNFEISKIFPNKTALDEDIKKRWESEIMPGEYVLVSYGDYKIADDSNENEYVINHNIDKKTYNSEEINYNATLWRKNYYEKDLFLNSNIKEKETNNLQQQYDINSDFYKTFNLESKNYSKDFGISYDLITVLTGNTPLIELDDMVGAGAGVEVLPPLESPEVLLSNSDINNPKIGFKLPRSVRFFYGTDISTVSEFPPNYNDLVESYATITKEELDKEGKIKKIPIEKGDYYINSSTGYVFLLQNIEKDGKKIFSFQGDNQPSAPISKHKPVSPFYRQSDTGELKYNYSKINFIKKNDHWEAMIESPTVPSFKGEAVYVGPDEKIANSIEGRILDEYNYNYKFNIPRGPRVLTGDEISNDPNNQNDPTLTPTAELGDLYLNTSLDPAFAGHVYKLIEEEGIRQWKDQGSIRGPMGNGLKVVNNYIINENTQYWNGLSTVNVGPDTLENVSRFLDFKNEKLAPDEVIVVTYEYEAKNPTEVQIQNIANQAVQRHDEFIGAHRSRHWLTTKEENAKVQPIKEKTKELRSLKQIKNNELNIATKEEEIAPSDEKYIMDKNYWYYQLTDDTGQKKWYRICITSGLYTVLQDNYIDSLDEGKIYSTKYINNLIYDDDIQTNNFDIKHTTYSRRMIKEKFDELTSYWESF